MNLEQISEAKHRERTRKNSKRIEENTNLYTGIGPDELMIIGSVGGCREVGLTIPVVANKNGCFYYGDNPDVRTGLERSTLRDIPTLVNGWWFEPTYPIRLSDVTSDKYVIEPSDNNPQESFKFSRNNKCVFIKEKNQR